MASPTSWPMMRRSAPDCARTHSHYPTLVIARNWSWNRNSNSNSTNSNSNGVVSRSWCSCSSTGHSCYSGPLPTLTYAPYQEMASDGVKMKLRELESLRKSISESSTGAAPNDITASAAAGAASSDGGAVAGGKVRFADELGCGGRVTGVGEAAAAPHADHRRGPAGPLLLPAPVTSGDHQVLHKLYLQLERNQRNIADFLRSSSAISPAGEFGKAPGGAVDGEEAGSSEASGVVVALAVPGGLAAVGGIEGLQHQARAALASALEVEPAGLHLQAMLSSPAHQEEGHRVLLCVLLDSSGASVARSAGWMSEEIQGQLRARTGPFCGAGLPWSVLSVALLPHIGYFTAEVGDASAAAGQTGQKKDAGRRKIDVGARAENSARGDVLGEEQGEDECKAQVEELSHRLRTVEAELEQARLREERAAAEVWRAWAAIMISSRAWRHSTSRLVVALA